MTNLEKRIKDIEKQIERMEENNDGSIGWVDEIRDLYVMLDELQQEQLRRNAKC